MTHANFSLGTDITVHTFNGGRATGTVTGIDPGRIILTTVSGLSVHIDPGNVVKKVVV